MKFVFFAVLIITSHLSAYARDISYALSGSLGLVSDYIPMSGTQVGKGTSVQSGTSISKGHFKTYLWSNYGLPEKAFTEIDYGVEYFNEISQNIYAAAGVHQYHFPKSDLHNWNLEAACLYRSYINFYIRYTYCLDSNDFLSGGRLHVTAERDLTGENAKMHLYTSISSAYHWGYYGWEGFAHVTPKIRVAYELSDILSMDLFSAYQISVENIKQESDCFMYGGIALSFNIKK